MAMKINLEHRAPEGPKSIQKGKEVEKIDILKGHFLQQMKKFNDSNFDARVQMLFDNITEQGEKVAKTRDMREVMRYKTLISEFMHEVTSETHSFEKQNFLDKRGRHRMYGIVKKVNGALEELTQDVLNKEKDNIHILQKVEDIRGMLIDLYM